MNSDQQLIQTQCTQALMGFYTNLDQRNYDEAIAYLDEDAVWIRLGQKIEGRGAIREVMDSRFPDIVAYHSLANLLFTAIDQDSAQATFLNTILTAKVAEKGPATELTLRAVVRVNPRFRKVGGQWLLSFLDGAALMVSE